jgi:hypothetical protein
LEDIGLNEGTFNDSLCKMWNKSNAAAISRMIYLTDDVLSRQILDKYNYPGFDMNGMVLFRCRKFVNSSFCKDLKHFWSVWVSTSHLSVSLLAF